MEWNYEFANLCIYLLKFSVIESKVVQIKEKF